MIDTVAEYADKVIGFIRDDVRDGVVPSNVKGFGELHQWVDANVYLIKAGQVYDGSEQSARESNAIEDAVTAKLVRGEHMNEVQQAARAVHAEARSLVERLAAHIYDADPESADWSYVADLNRVNQYLRYALGEES